MAKPTTEVRPLGWSGIRADFSHDREVYPIPWQKFMMWLFLVGDIFVFGLFLSAYAAARVGSNIPWPEAKKIFALHVGHTEVPLLLIAIMTFVLISSSGFMALAVAAGYARERKRTATLLWLTVLCGLVFEGMQAFEWAKLIGEGVRPWSNPFGAPQFGASFFMLTGFHGLHVLIGVVYLIVTALRVQRGAFEAPGMDYTGVEVAGLYWHFVDLVWVFIFCFFYLF